MDTRFPTYANQRIWKPADLTERVRSAVFNIPEEIDRTIETISSLPLIGETLAEKARERIPQVVDPRKLNTEVDPKILTQIDTIDSKTKGVYYTSTASLQRALIIALSQVDQIYDNKRFEKFTKGLVPELKKHWMSYAQMAHVGFELMKLSSSCQPIELQPLYEHSVKELRIEYEAGHAYNPRKSEQFFDKAGKNPQVRDIQFEDLLVSSWRHQFPFREFVKGVITYTIKHLKNDGKLANATLLGSKPGNKRGDPNHSLVYLP